MDINDVKACLVGLLSSSKFAYDLKSLLEDFEEMSGCCMPLFGHNNAIEFLKTLSDVLKLSGDNLNPKVHLIVSKKSAHIVSLVDKQRVSSKLLHKKNFSRRVVLRNENEENWRKSNLQGQKMASKTLEKSKTYSFKCKDLFQSSKRDGDNLRKKKISSYNSEINISTRSRVKIKENPNFDLPVKGNSIRDPLHDEHLQLEEEHKSLYSHATNKINENVKKKLKVLIKEHYNGLWCCELPKLFFQKFKYELNYKEFGYTSLINMLSDLPEIFRCFRPGQDDWILFDASAPLSEIEKLISKLNSKEKLPKEVQENLKSILNCNKFFQNGNNDLDTMLASVSKKKTSDYVFPNDVMGPNDIIDDIDLKNHVSVGQKIDIYFSEIWSPSLFYVHLEKFNVHFKRFMYDLQHFYDQHISEYKMPEFVLKPNQICAGLYTSDPQYPEEWHRVEIVDIVSERMVIVNFVDFGTEAIIKKNKLRFLHRAFQFFPAQGIAASLAGVSSFNNEKDWSISASAKLFDLLHFSKLKADVVSIDYSGKPKLNLIVYHSNNLSGPSLNKQLVDEKLARIKGTILISRDKSYEKCINTKNFFKALANLPKSSIEREHLEVDELEKSKKKDCSIISKMTEDISRKDDNFFECSKLEAKIISKYKVNEQEVFQEAVVERSFLSDIDDEDIYLESVPPSIQQKPSCHYIASTQNFNNQVINEDVKFKNKFKSSKLELTKLPQFAYAIFKNLLLGLEVEENKILNFTLFQLFSQQKQQVYQQLLSSNLKLKKIAMHNFESVWNISKETFETYENLFYNNPSIPKIYNFTNELKTGNFYNFFFLSLLTTNLSKKILHDKDIIFLSKNIVKMHKKLPITFFRSNNLISNTLKILPSFPASVSFVGKSHNFIIIFSVSSLENTPDHENCNPSKVKEKSSYIFKSKCFLSFASCLFYFLNNIDTFVKNQSVFVDFHFSKNSNLLCPYRETWTINSNYLYEKKGNYKIVFTQPLHMVLHNSFYEKSSSYSLSISHKSTLNSKKITLTTNSNNIISIDSKGHVTNDVFMKKNLKYVKAEKINGKTIHLILKDKIYVCVEEIIQKFTFFSKKREVVNLLIQSRSQYFDFTVLSWADNKDIMLELTSCSLMNVIKKKKRKQKIKILALSKASSFLQSLNCDINPYAIQFQNLQEKYNDQVSTNLTRQEIH